MLRGRAHPPATLALPRALASPGARERSLRSRAHCTSPATEPRCGPSSVPHCSSGRPVRSHEPGRHSRCGTAEPRGRPRGISILRGDAMHGLVDAANARSSAPLASPHVASRGRRGRRSDDTRTEGRKGHVRAGPPPPSLPRARLVEQVRSGGWRKVVAPGAGRGHSAGRARHSVHSPLWFTAASLPERERRSADIPGASPIRGTSAADAMTPRSRAMEAARRQRSGSRRARVRRGRRGHVIPGIQSPAGAEHDTWSGGRHVQPTGHCSDDGPPRGFVTRAKSCVRPGVNPRHLFPPPTRSPPTATLDRTQVRLTHEERRPRSGRRGRRGGASRGR